MPLDTQCVTGSVSDRSISGVYSFHCVHVVLGMYLGAVTGLVFQSIIGWKRMKIPHWSIIALLAVFAAAFGIDGSNSYLYLLKQVSPGILPNIPNLYVPNNTLRLLTGSGMGLGMGVMLFPAFNQTIWIGWRRQARHARLEGVWRSVGHSGVIRLAGAD